MATKSSNSKTRKTTTKKIDENIKNDNTILNNDESKDSTNTELQELRNMVGSLQSMILELKNQNEELKNEKIELEKNISEKTINEDNLNNVSNTINVTPLSMDDVNRKVTVYHTQEMSHNLSTYIKLSTTKRNLRKAGEIVRFNINDFEELVGLYRRFFDKGILAVSSKDMDFAEMYDLPIWDDKNKKTYTSKILKEVPTYNFEKLQNFYNDLSETSKTSFLSFWLGKVYSKEQGYYDVEKLGWLKNIANTGIFDSIILEMNTNAARGNGDVVLDANKMN